MFKYVSHINLTMVKQINKILTFFTLFFISLISINGAIGDYTQLNDLPIPTGFGGMTEYDGLLYIFGGHNGASISTNVYEYDISTGLYTSKTSSLETGVYGYGYSKIGDTFYMVGGYDLGNTAQSLTQKYNLDTDTWGTITAYPEGAIGDLSCATDDIDLYCFGGLTSGGDVISTYKYSVSLDSWTQLADLPIVTLGLGSVIYNNGSIYYSGGYDSNLVNDVATLYRYNIISNDWTTLSSSSVTLKNHVLSVENNTIYSFGGNADGTPTSTQYIYDINLDSWSTGVSSPEAKIGIASVLYLGNVYLMGGFDSSFNGSTSYVYELSIPSTPSPDPFNVSLIGISNNDVLNVTSLDDDLSLTYTHNSELIDLTCDSYLDGLIFDTELNVVKDTPISTLYSDLLIAKSYTYSVTCYNNDITTLSEEITFSVNLIEEETTGFFGTFLGDLGGGFAGFLTAIQQPVIYFIIVLGVSGAVGSLIYAIVGRVKRGMN